MTPALVRGRAGLPLGARGRWVWFFWMLTGVVARAATLAPVLCH